MSLPIVAVIGRPNVGKSTLFNRVVGSRIAIVDDQPGVTRDRNFSPADWAGRHFLIVDTGGVIEESERPLDRFVREQAEAAIDEADVLVLVVDGKEGLHPLDQKVAEMLRSSGKPVVLAVNKMDNMPRDMGHHEFWELGLGDPHPVSAGSGKGSGDLLDRIVEVLPEADAEPDDPTRVKIAVVGKPNVGKSSLVNRLFGEERSVVSDEAGTTRDPIDSTMVYHGRRGISATSSFRASMPKKSATQAAAVRQRGSTQQSGASLSVARLVVSTSPDGLGSIEGRKNPRATIGSR